MVQFGLPRPPRLVATTISMKVNVSRLCRQRSILTVNGGPTIHARKGDVVVVKVHNHGERNVTIHWHGVKQPRNPWSEYIKPGGSFTYRVILSEEEGTASTAPRCTAPSSSTPSKAPNYLHHLHWRMRRRIRRRRLTVVATDARYTKPFTVDHVMVASGQTLDLLLHANNANHHYYMAARTSSATPPSPSTTAPPQASSSTTLLLLVLMRIIIIKSWP
ncbi:hypothetical protein PR202_gb28483 [Eleusine coracana subsp. coracana]|uniref:Plastocyanin-like domain-containing protein n=1 Tax=Eleusine coracana subsp. coracana TaxID=191504 RepID=A0AAV5FY04_ELECO|nr:hypothetical protein PR202_gb28483 [Eleusine coracana subsp. coracana]